MSDWGLKYIGTKPNSCATLALNIQKTEFNKEPNIGVNNYKYADREKLLQEVNAVIVNESELVDGDIVLMSSDAKNNHVGTVIFNNGIPHIIHFLNKNLGVSVISLRWLKVLPGLNIERFYRLV